MALSDDFHDVVVEGVNSVLCVVCHVTRLKLCDALWGKIVA